MLYLFVIAIIGSLVYYARELFENKRKLYAFLILSFLAILCGVIYTADPYANSLMESYVLFRRVVN